MKTLLFLVGLACSASAGWSTGRVLAEAQGNGQRTTDNEQRVVIGQLASDGRCEAGVTGDGEGVTPIPGGER